MAYTAGRRGGEGDAQRSQQGGQGGDEHQGHYDDKSNAAIHLSSGLVLYLASVESMLALVCLTREESFGRRGVVDYNIGVFKEAMRRMIVVTRGGR